MAAKDKRRTITKVCDAKTGQYVPKEEAERRPATTVTETEKKPRKKR